MGQTVVPMVAYEDAAAAIDWLTSAFGFEEIADERYTEDGRITHAELRVGGDASIYVANPTPTTSHRSAIARNARRPLGWSSVPWVVDGLLVHVDDVKAHFAQAETAGARMLSPVEEGPDGLRYRTEDLEGHRWMFVGT